MVRRTEALVATRLRRLGEVSVDREVGLEDPRGQPAADDNFLALPGLTGEWRR
jgi:hypothetical protein